MKRILTIVSCVVSMVVANAQNLTLVKDYTWTSPLTEAGYSQWVVDTQFSTETVTIGTAGNKGIGDFDGLYFQGADKFYYIYHVDTEGNLRQGVLQNNSGDRTLGIIDAKQGQRIRLVISTENVSKLNGGKAAYAEKNVELHNVSNLITVRDEFQEIWFNVTAEGGAAIKLCRSSYYEKLEVYDVAPLSDAEKATYTVKFVDENGNEIKEALTLEGKIGEKPEFFIEKYTSSFTLEDGSMKYNYDSNDFDQVTLAATGSVATVKFKAVEKWTYSFSYSDFETGSVVKVDKGSTFADETVIAYDGWVKVGDKMMWVSPNKGLEGLAGEETGNYSFKLDKSGFEGETIVCSPEVTYEELVDKEDKMVYGMVYFAEAEDVSPYPYASLGVSGGKVGQVEGGSNSSKLLTLGSYTPGDYFLLTNIVANGGRSLVLRSYKQGPDLCLTDATGANMHTESATGEIKWSFSITEEMCDSILEDGTKVCVLTLGGKDQSGDGKKFNQSADYDYVALFKKGSTGAVVTPGDETPEVGDAISDIRIELNNEDGVIYDLMGRKVAPENVTKGIYIKNGKKFLVK